MMVALGQRAPAAWLPLLRGLADLKRIRSSGRIGSLAERLFAEAWSAIAAGQAIKEVRRTTMFDALAATCLGDLDRQTLACAGVPSSAIAAIRRQVVSEAAASIGGEWPEGPELRHAVPPAFVGQLADQPRAGATCPGRGRLMLEPPESHADHCLMVAVFGVILAPVWGADPDTVFLASLAHHLHNALLPDAGFAGEMALGEWLGPAMTAATDQALAQLPADVRRLVEQARRILPDADAGEGQAFHAADTLDRVLQVEHHLRAAGTTMDFVLRDMELVHAGPVKPFQDAVLQTMGLAA